MGRHFHKRIDGNLYVFGDRLDNGSWQIRVVDGASRPIEDEALRVGAIKEALADESALRAALWGELPQDVQQQIKKRGH